MNRSIDKAKKIPRKVALLKIKKKTTENRPVFAIKYDPRLPAMHQIVAKHWRSMVSQNKYLKGCFKEPPLIDYRRQSNLRNFLIKSKVAPPAPPYPKRIVNGMNKCFKGCTTCPFVQQEKTVKIDDKTTWNIGRKVKCESFNIVYMLTCKKCGKQICGNKWPPDETQTCGP